MTFKGAFAIGSEAAACTYARTHRPITARLTNAEHARFAAIAARHGVPTATYACRKLKEAIAAEAAELGADDFEDAKLVYGEPLE